MKSINQRSFAQYGAKRIPMVGLILAAAVMLPHHSATAVPNPIDFDSAFGGGASYAGSFDVVGQTLPAGECNDSGLLSRSGALKHGAQGGTPTPWFLTASDDAAAKECHVDWQAGSPAMPGTGAGSSENILTLGSITLSARALSHGRTLVPCGPVTLKNICITRTDSKPGVAVPDSGSTLTMLGFGLATLLTLKRRILA